MSEPIPILSKQQKAVAAALAAFVSEQFGAELARRCIRTEVCRSPFEDGFAVRLHFDYHGIVSLKAVDKDMAGTLEKLTIELRAMVAQMRASITELMSAQR